MSKGSNIRPRQVDDKTWSDNYDRIFKSRGDRHTGSVQATENKSGRAGRKGKRKAEKT